MTNIGSGDGGCQIHITQSLPSSLTAPNTWEVPVVITATSSAAAGLGGTLEDATMHIEYDSIQDKYTISLTVPNTPGLTDPDPLVITGTTTEGCSEGVKTGTFTGSGAENDFPCYNGAVVEPNKIADPWTGSFSFSYSYPS